MVPKVFWKMRSAGGVTFGQDEESALIYGMPRAAFERGAVMQQCSLAHMADAILDACESVSSPGGTRSPRDADAA
jgi:two-component system chemotaxis response regulator CheB